MTMHDGEDEIGEWIDALKAVERHRGHERAKVRVNHLVDQARRDGLHIPRSLNTACKNTISPEQEVKAPSDRRDRAREDQLLGYRGQGAVEMPRIVPVGGTA